VGPQIEKVGSSRSVRASMSFFLALRCSFWFPDVLDVEVDDSREGFPEMLLRDVSFTWLLSLPTWGSM
jgi:hypothetical protein